MKRVGYTFGGWYTDEACTPGNEFSFGNGLTDDTTVYAKWTPNEQAAYTVIIWLQNVNGDGYDFEESIPLSGVPGNAIDAVVSHGTGNGSYASVNGTDKQYTGFHLKEFDSDVTIGPEGNSVVHVYYDRTVYTLHFQDYVYTQTVASTETQYGLVNGQYVQLSLHNFFGYYYWTYNNGTVYTGPRYRRSGSQDVKTITARYQQNISDNFPIVGTNGVTYNNGERWDPQSDTPYNQVLVYIDVMPAANVTFRVDVANRPLKTMNYYVEALPGQTGTVSYQGRQFVLYKSVSARYQFVTEAEDYIDLVGFTKFGTNPAFVNGKALHSDYSESINMYYTRDYYQINYMDGVYVDGNGNPINEQNQGQLGISSDILYNADISTYNKDGADFYKPTSAGYAFEGWYLDENCTHPCTFANMPEGGITVYAKWVQTQYRVFLHPNVPETDTTLDWGSPDQAMNFRVSYGGKVSAPTGLRQEYEFVGWYLDESFTRVFNPDAFVLNDTTVTTPYDKTVDMTDTMNKWGNIDGVGTNSDATGYNGGERFWITRKLDLYAKWRRILIGADGVGILYDATPGTNEPHDILTYLDSSAAVAGAASTPPAGKQFDHWVVQRWDATADNGAGAYVDTDVTVLPGETFEVRASDAKVTAQADNTPTHPSYTYVIQLRAVYSDEGAPSTTMLVFDANGGSFAAGTPSANEDLTKVETTLEVNHQIDVPAAPARTGYVFKGWGTSADATDPLLEPGTDYAADNLDGTAWDAEQNANVLYAIWERKPVTLVIRKELTGDMANLTQGFTFTVTNADGATLTTVALHDRKGTQALGETATVAQLANASGTFVPLYWGDTVTITEADPTGYVASYTVSLDSNPPSDVQVYSATGASVTLNADTTTVVFTNEKTPIPVTGIRSAVGSNALQLALGVGAGVALASVVATRMRRDRWRG